MRKQLTGFAECAIPINKPTPLGEVVPAAEVVQLGFFVVYIAPVAEGVERAECGRQRAGFGEGGAPGIVNYSD